MPCGEPPDRETKGPRGLQGHHHDRGRALRRAKANSAIRTSPRPASLALASRLQALRTLWINTGSLCNIECRNCYIESSPENDRLVYMTRAEVASFLDEIAREALPTREIGFTGGEPFMNPDILAMLGDALDRGHSVLVLTNAMQPMQRPRIKSGLLALREAHGDAARHPREPRSLRQGAA